jgi:DNA excision repair protein ERCC-2
MDSYFPYDKVRPTQKEFIETVEKALESSKHAILHAPTGLGKTAAVLAPAVKYAIENKKVIFFLTSRHTQHLMAIQTLRDIQEKSNEKFCVIDLIAKQNMCPVDGMIHMHSTEFGQYCKEARETRNCRFYAKTKKSDGVITPEAEMFIQQLSGTIHHTDEIMEHAKNNGMCAYELAVAAAKEATVIVADYYYIFNEMIQAPFFARLQKDLDDAIVIVDEAHNLPQRIKELASSKLSTVSIHRAINEADRGQFEEALVASREMFRRFEQFIDQEDFSDHVVEQEFFRAMVEQIGDYDEIKGIFEDCGARVLKKKRQSYLLSLAMFMNMWKKEGDGFTRIVSLDMYKNNPMISLSFRCLDPAVVAAPIINRCHSVILMSGTLLPTDMYCDLLGFEKNRTILEDFENPFPKHNALHWIVPETTTKYSERNEGQYNKIAEYVTDITNRVEGSSAVFFPSYGLRDTVISRLKCDKQLFIENPALTKQEKSEFINSFKNCSREGAILLGAASGSFGEGIDLPGDLLRCVIIVGLPLGKPDVETQELIKYYDKKFGKGWDYGYTFPAFNRTLQNAGRCIRSETDKGIIVYLDQRYTWRNYFKCFPKDLNMVITTKTKVVDMFFDQV